MLAFQYICYLDSKEVPKVIVDVTTVVAKDLKTAELLAARSIPKKYEDRLSEIKVVVRPFDSNPTYYSYYYPNYYYPYYTTYLNSSGVTSIGTGQNTGNYSNNASLNSVVTSSTKPVEPTYLSASDILNSAV